MCTKSNDDYRQQLIKDLVDNFYCDQNCLPIEGISDSQIVLYLQNRVIAILNDRLDVIYRKSQVGRSHLTKEIIDSEVEHVFQIFESVLDNKSIIYDKNTVRDMLRLGIEDKYLDEIA